MSLLIAIDDMSGGEEYLSLLISQLNDLKKQVGNVFHKQLRESIGEAKEYVKEIQNTDKQINISKALAPFFIAMKDEKKAYQGLVLDTFYKVFHHATEKCYPNKELTFNIIKCVLDQELDPKEEIWTKVCNLCSCIQNSKSGILYVHGEILQKLFRLIFKVYNATENQQTIKLVDTTIRPIVTLLFTSYTAPPEILRTKTVQMLAANIVQQMVDNSLEIINFVEPYLKQGEHNPSIRDVDLFVFFTTLAKVIEFNATKLRTKILATKLFINALKLDHPFLQTSLFKHLLNTTLHVTFLSLTLNSQIELAESTAELILTLWERFASVYTIGLNELMVKGLMTTLISPDQNVLMRSLTVFGLLCKQPQLLVDFFVNYDCDESGFFQNVFENSINSVVKLAYPDAAQPHIQVLSLHIITEILKQLYDYFENLQNSKKQEPSTPQTYLDAKKAKDVFTEGLGIFKRSFKKGLAFFVQHNIVEDTPEAIAKFLYNTPSLDPAMVGETIGSSGEKSISILRCFTNIFDFKGLTFEQAFRLYLGKFQVPGEAQMIDRVMEQFGTKFYNDNPTLFSSADTVYVLAFSTLMLHTDAWHPNVKSRMTLQQFIANNSGIDNGKDLPYELLEDLYKGITSKRIFLPSGAMPNSALLTRAQRADLYASQCKATLEQARSRSQAESKEWKTAESPMFVAPMFNVIWRGCLAALTITFETSNDRQVYSVCLEGLSTMVHIASRCFIETALDTLVDAFAKFTNMRKGATDIRLKNIECTNTLLQIAYDDRHFLRGAWDIVIGEISSLEKINLPPEINATLNVNLIDELFTSTVSLDRESLVDFVRALCSVSKQELQEKPARIYSLQKVSVVAHFNVKRPKFLWVAVWDIIGDYLNFVGTLNKPGIPELAIDMTRQLASKFLLEEELINFHFQKRFMSPFQHIFDNQRNVQVKDLVLTCISALVSELAENLQSGWVVVFQVLTSAASGKETCTHAFEVVEQMINTRMKILQPQMIHVLNVLSSFIGLTENLTIRSRAAEFFGPVSHHIPKNDDEKWSALLQCIFRYASDREEAVRAAMRGAFLNDVVQMNDCDEDVWKECLLLTAPQFFNDVKDEELYSFVGDITKIASPNHEHLVISFLLNLVYGANNNGVTSVAIANLSAVKLPMDDKSVLSCREGIDKVVANFEKISPENQIAFCDLLMYFCQDPNIAPKCYEAIHHLKIPDAIMVHVRTPLLVITNVVSGDMESRIVLADTFRYFLERLDQKPKKWNEAAKFALEFLLKSNDFQGAFELSKDSIIAMIETPSKEVRKAVAAVLAKRLLE
ncbi:Sec7 domain containing protein [Trichomonas vaginalis G3]|uniref:Sec7 domain containing protein n=1 Tax=Trichomonas vaginalis (strain ATCC PRA-98 / G3) TaxID=412133 RepID=A2DXM2_TRIV3|nr:guanyl-nucleotide exchange factor family [Trichomonas vaginalis G3]EAY14851.1 Sec7 domain containing protein [Trichomonas vaginalis G3]KAI5541168.1 guanyl-nucleotide exchange factor family [Trichomonas vaginalis G3]|eukprot:XP_001327074.1 Sec7 domain containing protein [Trichomonas vaginalis G3]